jgi:hypothetical protein
MHTELKKAIIDFMFENKNTFQLVTMTKDKFRQYIYTPEGSYCIGGNKVANFIELVYRDIIND